MKVLQETPSLRLVQDPFFEFSEFWGTCKEPLPSTLPLPPFTSWIMCLYVLSVLQVFRFPVEDMVEVDSRCLNDQKLCFIDLLKKKCFIAKCLFKKKKIFYFCWADSASIIGIQDGDFWSECRFTPGFVLFNFAHKCYLYLREYLLKNKEKSYLLFKIDHQHHFFFFFFLLKWTVWIEFYITVVCFVVCPREGKLSTRRSNYQVGASRSNEPLSSFQASSSL